MESREQRPSVNMSEKKSSSKTAVSNRGEDIAKIKKKKRKKRTQSGAVSSAGQNAGKDAPKVAGTKKSNLGMVARDGEKRKKDSVSSSRDDPRGAKETATATPSHISAERDDAATQSSKTPSTFSTKNTTVAQAIQTAKDFSGYRSPMTPTLPSFLKEGSTGTSQEVEKKSLSTSSTHGQVPVPFASVSGTKTSDSPARIKGRFSKGAQKTADEGSESSKRDNKKKPKNSKIFGDSAASTTGGSDRHLIAYKVAGNSNKADVRSGGTERASGASAMPSRGAESKSELSRKSKKKKKRKRLDPPEEPDNVSDKDRKSETGANKKKRSSQSPTPSATFKASQNQESDGEDKDKEPKWEGPHIVHGLTLNVAAASLNSHLTCTLCKGYYRDPQTIPECLHTFCKSCIWTVFYHGFRKCPKCRISLEPDPYQHLLSDRAVQELLVKLFPAVVQNDLEAEDRFVESRRMLEDKDDERRGKDTSDGGGADALDQETPMTRRRMRSLEGGEEHQDLPASHEPAIDAPPLPPPELSPGSKQAALRDRPLPLDELDFLLLPDTSAETTKTQRMPPLQNPLIRVSGKLKIVQLRKYLIKKLNMASSDLEPSAVEILCHGDPLGDELSLTFIHRTRWFMATCHVDGGASGVASSPDKTAGVEADLTLTFRLSDEGRF
jgi:hypothetical protein